MAHLVMFLYTAFYIGRIHELFAVLRPLRIVRKRVERGIAHGQAGEEAGLVIGRGALLREERNGEAGDSEEEQAEVHGDDEGD